MCVYNGCRVERGAAIVVPEAAVIGIKWDRKKEICQREG